MSLSCNAHTGLIPTIAGHFIPTDILEHYRIVSGLDDADSATCNSTDRLCTIAQSSAICLSTRVRPHDAEVGREKGPRSVRWVRRWASVREKAMSKGSSSKAKMAVVEVI